MGDPKRLRKLYEKPLKVWDKQRIEEEKGLVDEFALKNMKELWRAKTILRKIRREVRRMLGNKGTNIEQRKKEVIDRVKKFLIRKQDVVLDDILSLEVRDVLARRLQTIIRKKQMATTLNQSRQFITHGHIAIKNHKVTAPSYLVKFDEEDAISWYTSPIVLKPREKEGEKVVDKVISQEAAKVEQPAVAEASGA